MGARAEEGEDGKSEEAPADSGERRNSWKKQNAEPMQREGKNTVKKWKSSRRRRKQSKTKKKRAGYSSQTKTVGDRQERKRTDFDYEREAEEQMWEEEARIDAQWKRNSRQTGASTGEED